jgi:hypothetical protein
MATAASGNGCMSAHTDFIEDTTGATVQFLMMLSRSLL